METNQQMFDAAWEGLKAQGFVKCITEYTPESARWEQGVSCGWEDTNGRRCALGHTNFKYRREAYNLPYAVAYEPFVVGLRACHNLATSPADMECRLREFAAQNGLIVPADPFKRFMEKVREPVSLVTEREALR